MTTATAEKKPERIRGPHLAVLVKHSSRVPFEEGLRKANDQNLVLVIASNKRLKAYNQQLKATEQQLKA